MKQIGGEAGLQKSIEKWLDGGKDHLLKSV